MKRLLSPHVADYYVDGVRVIQHDVLCNQPQLEAIIEDRLARARDVLHGAPLKAVESTTIELFQDTFVIEGVSMAHQAAVRGPGSRRCNIKISVDDQLERRVEECFAALVSHFQASVRALTEQ